jgi:epsilon-lactone hydrolase
VTGGAGARLLSHWKSAPCLVSQTQRRERLDEVGSVWPVAKDVKLDAVDLDGLSIG